jgi:hypothetical protein
MKLVKTKTNTNKQSQTKKQAAQLSETREQASGQTQLEKKER